MPIVTMVVTVNFNTSKCRPLHALSELWSMLKSYIHHTEAYTLTEIWHCVHWMVRITWKLLEGHSVEHIYLRQRSSDGSANKTILKSRLALATCHQFFPDIKFRVAAQLAGSLSKAAKFHSLYDIGETNAIPASGLWSGSGSKVNQFVHVLTSVDTHFIQIHACVFE